jgi:hypothetical protein
MVLDVKNFYYGTPMARYKYMKLPLKLIPTKIVNQYNLLALASDGSIYMEIRKGMPGLKQAGQIANDRLQVHFKQFGYAPVPHTHRSGNTNPDQSLSPWSWMILESNM